MMRRVLFAAPVLLLAKVAYAGPPRIGRVLFFETDSSPPATVFQTSTPVIKMAAELLEVPAGTPIILKWIAVKVSGAPPEFEIANINLAAAPPQAGAAAQTQMSRPSAGWPVGEYRVDVLLNGTVAKSAPFTVRA
jgi:hypothetical protein